MNTYKNVALKLASTTVGTAALAGMFLVAPTFASANYNYQNSYQNNYQYTPAYSNYNQYNYQQFQQSNQFYGSSVCNSRFDQNCITKQWAGSTEQILSSTSILHTIIPIVTTITILRTHTDITMRSLLTSIRLHTLVISTITTTSKSPLTAIILTIRATITDPTTSTNTHTSL
jgi:hypothetical protein